MSGRIEVSRDVMVAFGQAALTGNVRKLSTTDRKIIQSMMDGLLNNQQSVVLDGCDARRLDRMMSRLASSGEGKSKLKQLSHGFATILGRRIPAEKLLMQSRAAVSTARFHSEPAEHTFKEMIEQKKAYGTKRPPVKKTGEPTQKMQKIVTLPERREMQVRQRGKEEAYLDEKRQKVFDEFEDLQIIKNLWASIASGKLPSDSIKKYRENIIKRMGLIVDDAIQVAVPGLQKQLNDLDKRGDYNKMIQILEQSDPYRTGRLRSLLKCKNNLETYLVAKIEPDIEAWRKEAWSDLKKKDKELKQMESSLQRMRLAA